MNEKCQEIVVDYKEGLDQLVEDKDKQNLSDHTMHILTDAGMSAAEAKAEMGKVDGETFSQKSYDSFVEKEKEEAERNQRQAERKERYQAFQNKADTWAKSHIWLFGLLLIVATMLVNNIYWVIWGVFHGGSAVIGNPYLQGILFTLVAVVVIATMGTKDLGKKGQVIFSSALLIAGLCFASTFWLQVLHPRTSARTASTNQSVSGPEQTSDAAAQTNEQTSEEQETSPVPPRPTIAGQEVSDLDMWVLSANTPASTFAYYSLVYVEWDQTSVSPEGLREIRSWMEKHSESVPKVAPEELVQRTSDLVVLGGAKGIGQDGLLIPATPEDKEILEKIIARLN